MTVYIGVIYMIFYLNLSINPNITFPNECLGNILLFLLISNHFVDKYFIKQI